MELMLTLLEELSSKDVIQHIIDWVKANPDALAKDEYALEVVKKGKAPWISNGTKPKDWKRRAKKKVGDEIIRIFMPEVTIYESRAGIAVAEKNGKIVRLEHGKAQDLADKYGVELNYGFA